MTGIDAKRELLRRLLAERETASRRFPTSFAQERLWFLNRLEPGNPFYNVEAAIPIAAAVDPDVLERSINEIVRRHGALRTTFRDPGAGPVQVVAHELHLPLQRVDLRALAPREREEAQLAIRRERARMVFDLEAGPLLVTDLLQLEDQRWLFLLNLHHIIADGWSMGVFSRELTTLYQAFAAGEPSPLPPLPLQYGDFAVWQRQAFSGDVLRRELAYWRTQLEGMAPLDLPTDRSRPAVQSHRGAFHTVQLNPALSHTVHEFCRRHSVTPFMTLLAAFKALLARYAHTDDIAVGTYIANRERQELEPLIGFFLNTLVLRTRIDPEAGFGAIVLAVKETALGAYAHQTLPFASLVQELAPERDLSRNPLVQVVFQLHSASTVDPAQGSQALADYQRGTAIFDIAITCYEAQGAFHATWEYSSDLFDPTTIEQMARHYASLLAAAAAAPEIPLHRLPLMDATERRRVLVDWNARHLPYPGQSLVAMLDERAGRHPDAPAFIEGERSLSYRALVSRSTALARRLCELGVRPGEVCAVCLPRGLHLPVALFAAWRAGATYLPLDPAYPHERLAYMLRDSAAVALIGAGASELAWALADGAGLPLLDPAAEPAFPAALPALPIWPGPDAVSHIIYTSGSTGRPKAAPSPHRQILNRLHWMWHCVPFEAEEVGCVKTATSFIDSLWELLGPLLQGRPAVIVPQAALLEPERLVELLARHRVSRIWLVPSYLRVLLDACDDLGARLPSLRMWVASGEVLPMELHGRFASAHPTATLFNLYGTSEVWDATWFDPRGCALQGLSHVPIGRPIDNVTCVVLDPWCNPVPPGVIGELHVGGDALGSLVESDRRVRVAPPGLPPQEFWACGDLVRWRHDGNLEFVGRRDAELKIRGMRVEPAEIESVLMEHADVRAAAALPWPGRDGAQRLVMYVAGGASGAAELRAFMARRLPSYALPAQFVFVDELPFTGSGKVDREQLRRGGDPLETVAPPSAGPTTTTEQTVAAIWAGLLGRPVGVDENFFAVGGHSLLAAQVVSRIEQGLGVRIELRRLFDAPTVAALAAAVDKARGPDGEGVEAIPRAPGRVTSAP